VAPPPVAVTANVSPLVGWAVPLPLAWAANSQPLPTPRVWPEASVKV
jgi:hypothetical protein